MAMRAAGTSPRAMRRGGTLRKILIALGVIVVIVAALVIAAPTIFSGYVGGLIESSVNKGIAGRVRVAKVGLSWTGPQRIGSIVLDDPSGTRIGEMSAQVDAGLFGLVTGSRNLGLLRVRGMLDLRHEKGGELNLAAAMAGTGKTQPITVPPGGAPPTKPSAPSEIRLPKKLAFQVDASELEIRYTPRGATPTPVGFKTTKAAGAFSVGKPADFEVEAETLDGRHALTVDFHADRLTDDQGVLNLRDAKMDLSVDGDVPVDYVDTIAEIVGGEPQPGVTVGPSDTGGVTLSATFVARDGRLTLADPDKPATMSGRIPAVLLRQIPMGEARVHFDSAPRVTIGIKKLDLPLPAAGSLLDMDFRNGVLVVAMSTDPISGTADGKAFTIDPIEPTLQQMDKLFDQIVTCTATASFADLKAGRVEIDLRAAGLLNENGRLRIGPFAPKGEGYALVPGPEYLRGVVRVFEFPTALIQPLVEKTGLKLEEVAGPTLAMDIRAGVRQGTDELPKEVTSSEGKQVELPPIGEPYLAGTLDSRYTTVLFDFNLVGERVKTRGEGIRVQSDAGVALLRPFIPADEITLTGGGKVIVEIGDVDIPMTGGKPDLRASSGSYRLVVGDLGVQTSPEVSPVYLDSLDTACSFSPNQTPTWGVDYRATAEGKKFAVVGNGTILGLVPGAGATGDFYGLSPREARPVGKLQLLDVPTSIASLISKRAAEIADAAAGPSLKGSIQSSELGDAGAHFDIAIEGDRAVVQGAFDAGPQAITFDDKGMALTFFDPGLLLNALAENGEKPPPLTFDDKGQAALTIAATSIPVRDFSADAPLRGVLASVKLEANDLSATVRSENHSSPLTLASLTTDLALTKGGDLTVAIDSKGQIAQEATSSSGTIAVRGLVGSDGRLDLAHARLDGSWKADNIPTSLVALVDPDQAEIVRQTVGDSIDVALTPKSGASRGGWNVAATGHGFTLESALALDQDALVVGPTTAHATLTPGVVDSVMAAYQPELSPRPSLSAPVPLDLTGDALTVALKDGYKPDTSAGLMLAGSVKAGADMVLTNLPGVEKGTTGTLGIRDLEIVAKPTPAKTTAVTLSMKAFSTSTDRVAATVKGDTSLPMKGLSGSIVVTDADTATLDTMFATKGLLQEIAGDRLSLEIHAPTPAPGQTLPLYAEVHSPRLQVNAKLMRSDQGFELADAAQAKWLVSKATANRLLFPTKEGEKPALQVDNDFNVSLNVGTLRTGPASGPLRADLFRLASEIQMGAISFTETKSGEKVTLPAREGRASVDPMTGALVVLLRGVAGQEASGAGAENASSSALSIDASIEGYADAAGKPTFDQARLTSTVTGELPTPVVDALANAGGLLTALVGPRMSADIKTTDFSEKAGTGSLKANVQAPYANLQIEGKMQPGQSAPVFATTQPGKVEIVRITNESSEQLFGVLFPLLTRFEKTPNDEPAVITATGLTLPLSHDTKDLNGVLRVDPGTMEFETKGFFSKILKQTHNVQTGQLGRKLQPFDITIERGVARYQDVVIPSGDYDLVTSGKVNLNRKTMDVYVFVPVFATNENIASVVRNIPGVGDLTRVPVHVNGGFNNPDVSVDPQEMIRSLPSNLGKGVEDVLKTPGDILERLFGGDKDKTDEKKKDGAGGGKKNNGAKDGGSGGGG